MEVVKQLAVFVANRPGALAEVCKRLKDQGVSILGLYVADSVDHAVLRLVVDKPNVAIHLLGNDGLLVLDTDILAVRLPNKPGMMFQLSNAFAEAGLNIEYAYGGVGPQDDEGVLYLKVVDLERAKEAMKKLGL